MGPQGKYKIRHTRPHLWHETHALAKIPKYYLLEERNPKPAFTVHTTMSGLGSKCTGKGGPFNWGPLYLPPRWKKDVKGVLFINRGSKKGKTAYTQARTLILALKVNTLI